jgi:hypothetical protein
LPGNIRPSLPDFAAGTVSNAPSADKA